jgi:gliding motility-associated-like protein
MPPRGAAYTLSDSLGCPPLTVNFSIPYLNTATYLWNFGDGTFGNSFSVSHTYTTKGNYNIGLVVNDTLCHTSDTAYSNILIHQKPLADFLVAADTFRFETPVTFTNNSLYYTHLLWNFGDGTTIADEEKPVHTYENIDWIKVCLVASNDFCEDTACKEIFISYKALIGVPNAFSPNGDGVNDVVKVEGKGIVELTFRIYNRWGEKVFETHDKNEGWNGLYKGVLQEMDVYTYAVEAKLINGDSVPLKGNITLLR